MNRPPFVRTVSALRVARLHGFDQRLRDVRSEFAPERGNRSLAFTQLFVRRVCRQRVDFSIARQRPQALKVERRQIDRGADAERRAHALRRVERHGDAIGVVHTPDAIRMRGVWQRGAYRGAGKERLTIPRKRRIRLATMPQRTPKPEEYRKSGQFNLRISSDIKVTLERKARMRGLTLSSYLISVGLSQPDDPALSTQRATLPDQG